MAVVVFDADTFRSMYPEFSNVADATLPYIFQQAELYLDNTEYLLVIDPDKRATLLYILMAHLLYMRFGTSTMNPGGAAGNGSGIVGRVSSATEGSVSVSSDMGNMEFRNAWYTQSPYGLDFWQATKVYRMATYFPGDCYVG